MQAIADNFDTIEQLQIDPAGTSTHMIYCIEYMLGKYYTWYTLAG